MCGAGVRSMLLLPLVARCLDTIDVCMWRMFVFMSVVVTVWRSVGLFVVQPPLLKIVLRICVGDVMDVVFYVCIVRRGDVGARVWEV